MVWYSERNSIRLKMLANNIQFLRILGRWRLLVFECLHTKWVDNKVPAVEFVLTQIGKKSLKLLFFPHRCDAERKVCGHFLRAWWWLHERWQLMAWWIWWKICFPLQIIHSIHSVSNRSFEIILRPWDFVGWRHCSGNGQLQIRPIWLPLSKYTGILWKYGSKRSTACTKMGQWEYRILRRWVIDTMKWIRTPVIQSNACIHWLGDKNRITIHGQSAGAAAVHLFTLIPQTRNLYQRAIASSGSMLCPWSYVNRLRNNHTQIVQHLIADEKSSIQERISLNEIIEYIQKVDGQLFGEEKSTQL